MPYYPNLVNSFAIGTNVGRSLAGPLGEAGNNLVKNAGQSYLKLKNLEIINNMGNEIENINNLDNDPQVIEKLKKEGIEGDDLVGAINQLKQERWNELRKSLPPAYQGFLPEAYSPEAAKEIQAKLAIAHQYHALDVERQKNLMSEEQYKTATTKNQYLGGYLGSRNKIAAGEAKWAERAWYCKTHNDPTCPNSYSLAMMKSKREGKQTPTGERKILDKIYDNIYKPLYNTLEETTYLEGLGKIDISRDAQATAFASLGQLLWVLKGKPTAYGPIINSIKSCVNTKDLDKTINCINSRFPKGYKVRFNQDTQTIELVTPNGVKSLAKSTSSPSTTETGGEVNYIKVKGKNLPVNQKTLKGLDKLFNNELSK